MSSKILVQPGFPCTVIFQFPGYLFPVSKSQHLIITVILINRILQFPVIVRICSIHIHKSLFRKQHDPMPASDALPCGFLLCQSACQFIRIYQSDNPYCKLLQASAISSPGFHFAEAARYRHIHYCASSIRQSQSPFLSIYSSPG